MANPAVQQQVAAMLQQANSAKTSTITISVNPQYASTVIKRTQPYKNFPNTLRPALENVANYVRVSMIPDIFDKEGPGWRRLSKRTQRERAAQGFNPQHPILRRTGDLFAELTQKSHPQHIEVIKVGKDCRITMGGSSEKFLRNQGGNSTFRIPARPMLPGTGRAVSDRDRTEIINILRKGIQDQLNKKRLSG